MEVAKVSRPVLIHTLHTTTYPPWQSADVPRKHQGTSSDDQRLDSNELAMEECDLHDKPGHMLSLGVLVDVTHASQPHPCFGGRMADGPTDSLKDVSLHLNKRAIVVCFATHIRELSHSWYSILCVLELGSNPERCTADQLVVLLVDDSLGDVTVDDVQREVENFRTKTELLMNFDKEVDQEWSHVPL